MTTVQKSTVNPPNTSTTNKFVNVSARGNIKKLSDLQISVTSANDFLNDTTLRQAASGDTLKASLNKSRMTGHNLIEAIQQRQSSLAKMKVSPLNIQKYEERNKDNTRITPNLYSTLRNSHILYSHAVNNTKPSSVNQHFRGNSIPTTSDDEMQDHLTYKSNKTGLPTQKPTTGIKTPIQTSPTQFQPTHTPITPQSGRSWTFENETESFGSLNSPPSLSYSVRLSDTDSTKTMERMRRRHNCVRELYNTEWMFAQDMAVIVRIYMCGSADLCLSMRQIDILFSNVTHIMDISLSLVAILESQIPAKILQGTGTLTSLDIAADEDIRVGRAMCMALTGQFYEIYESYIHRNKQQMELFFELTEPMRSKRTIAQGETINGSKRSSCHCKPDQEKLGLWLNKCKQRASKFTTAWSLDSLLIKPIQRLGKYPLFLSNILECSDINHKDYTDLQKAYKRSKHYLDCVNARYDQNIEHLKWSR